MAPRKTPQPKLPLSHQSRLNLPNTDRIGIQKAQALRKKLKSEDASEEPQASSILDKQQAEDVAKRIRQRDPIPGSRTTRAYRSAYELVKQLQEEQLAIKEEQECKKKAKMRENLQIRWAQPDFLAMIHEQPPWEQLNAVHEIWAARKT